MKESIMRFLMAKGLWIWAISWFSSWGLVKFTQNGWFYLIGIPGWLAYAGEMILKDEWICVCPTCNTKCLEPTERYCSKCGSATLIRRKLKKICPKGHKITDEWNLHNICPKCGGPLRVIEPKKEIEKQKKGEEKEREEIRKLISETEEVIKRITLQVKNPEFLAALKIMEGLELPEILQEFNDKEISYQEAKERILNLQKQAKILSTPVVEVEEETYYQILGVAEDASQEEIRKSYLRKIKEYHPDQFQDSKSWVKEMAEEMTKKLNEAFNILRDPKKRREYDQKIGIRR